MTAKLQSARLDGVDVAWRDSGSGEPFVLVHGLGGWRWKKFVERLPGSYRIVAPYLRGFGETRGPMEYSMEDLGLDLVRLIDRLGIGPVHLLGHSLGGMVAQVAVTDHPEMIRSLVLVSTTSHTGARARRFAAAMTKLSTEGAVALSDPSLRADVESILKEAFPEGPPPLELLAAGLSDPNPAQGAAWAAVEDFSRKDRLKEIACPVLVAHGTADLLIPPVLGRWIHEAIPGSRHIEFEGAGHSVQNECAEELAAFVLEFFSTIR